MGHGKVGLHGRGIDDLLIKMNVYRGLRFAVIAAILTGLFYIGYLGLREPPPTDVVYLASCRGKAGVDEGCTLSRDASACVARPCAKLVVTFSGAEMGCQNRDGYKKAMSNFQRHGYAAVCINYFDSFQGSLKAPFVDQAERLDEAVKAATRGEWAKRYWTGEELLFEGISHGATAPLALWARTRLAEQEHWHGTRRTGACLFDGSYDQIATADLLGRGDGGQGCQFPLTDQWVLERYCGPGVERSDCNLKALIKVAEDNLTQGPVNYAIRNFRLIECGSALDACIGDILPRAPIESVCRRIAGTAGFTCDFQALPEEGHLVCHGNRSDLCQAWFDSGP